MKTETPSSTTISILSKFYNARTECIAYKPIFLTFLLLFTLYLHVNGQENKRWEINKKEDGIRWNISTENRLPHQDHIEMSGRYISSIIRYEVDADKNLKLSRNLLWPTLRTIPKDTDPEWFVYRAYLKRTFADEILPSFKIGGKTFSPRKVSAIELNGFMTITYQTEEKKLLIRRRLFPAMDKPAFVEKWELTNLSSETLEVTVEVPEAKDQEKGVYGLYDIRVFTSPQKSLSIPKRATKAFAVYFSAEGNDLSTSGISFEMQEGKRNGFINEVKQKLVLKTPNQVYNTLFTLAKIRTSESLFETKMGLVHSPGGNSYYGGIWANDQVEYAGPFFPYQGYKPANMASLNAYRKFASVMQDDYKRIPSSFEMEGTLTCCSHDRGDAAMYAYGASKFLLQYGDRKVAEELWPAIEWSLEYNRRRKTPAGLIASESDEMEGRLPTGEANLSTSSLAYGGLKAATALAKSLDKPRAVIEQLEKEANGLAQAIEEHLGANVEGHETYEYFEGHDKLRHWISLPLVMGIENRKEGTLDALFNNLWTENGLAVTSGSEVFWDRGTLYALRGAFNVGAADRAHQFLKNYSETRLLGEHVPYPVEAFPEGGQAHLAAESALYCLVFLEGMLGIEPLGLNSFKCTPSLPRGWRTLRLVKIQSFNKDFDLVVKRVKKGVQLEVFKGENRFFSQVKPEGESFTIELH